MTKMAHPKPNRSRARRALLTALLLPLILLPGCKKEAEPQAQVAVQAVHPQPGPITEHITADAILTPLAQAAIAPRISAPVRRFYVQRGARVTKGELLAVLDNQDLAAAAEDSQGAYMAAQAAYATATQAQVPEEMLKAESDVAQTRANLDLAQSIANGRRQLFKQGAIPGRDLDTAEAALVQARAAYDAAAQHLHSLRSVSRAAALKAAQGQLTSAQARYQGAEAQVNYSRIRSPIDGVVTDRPLFAGETAPAGTTLLTVMETSTLLAKTHIAQSQAQQLKVGDQARVLVPGLAAPVPAKVALVSPALDPGSTTVEIWLRIDNRNGALKVGTPVKVSIAGRSAAHAIRIPAVSILTAQDGSKFVMVVGPDGAAHRMPVTLGLEDAGQVQVTSGVTPADLVVTTGAYGLEDGTRVKVAGANGEKSAGGDE